MAAWSSQPSGTAIIAACVILPCHIAVGIHTRLLRFLLSTVADVGRELSTKRHGAIAPLVIGFAVLAAHLFMIPIDGCSINPARSFGASAVATVWTVGCCCLLRCSFLCWWCACLTMLPDTASVPAIRLQDQWIFWVGPATGSIIAVVVHEVSSIVVASRHYQRGWREARSSRQHDFASRTIVNKIVASVFAGRSEPPFSSHLTSLLSS